MADHAQLMGLHGNMRTSKNEEWGERNNVIRRNNGFVERKKK